MDGADCATLPHHTLRAYEVLRQRFHSYRKRWVTRQFTCAPRPPHAYPPVSGIMNTAPGLPTLNSRCARLTALSSLVLMAAKAASMASPWLLCCKA